MKTSEIIKQKFRAFSRDCTGQRVLYLLGHYFCIVLLSVLYKLVFILFNSKEPCSVCDCFDAAYHGLPHDLAVAGYFTAIPLVLTIVSLFRNFAMRKTLVVYNSIIAFAIALAFIADFTLYPYWECKLDASVLIYLDSPANAMASITVWHFMLLAVILAALTYGIYRLLMLLKRKEFDECPKKALPATLLILFGGFMFLGIRGGISESTNNIGTVYYCDKPFLNEAAVNPIFSFLYTLVNNEDFSEEYRFFDEEERAGIFNGLYVQDPETTVPLLKETRPNIVTVILEGMSAELIESMGGMKGITPNLDRLSKEGVLFTECYANSFRTDRGLICALSGYPSFPKTSVMKDTRKSQSLPSLAQSLKRAGYDNTFLYGGDINFTNMNGYLYSTGYGKVISDKDFSSSERSSHQWGAGDDITFDRLFDIIMAQSRTPWHITYLTLSSHEPWTVPYNRIPGDEKANAFAFTDEQLGIFIDRLKATDVWNNTLVICIADHSVVNYPEGIEQTDRNRNHIPLLLLGGAIREPLRIDLLCNQSDLPATILSQLQLPIDEFIFSRNILSPSYTYPFAYHSYNNGISLIDSTGFSVFDLNGKKEIESKPAEGGKRRIETAKAILQSTYMDFHNR